MNEYIQSAKDFLKWSDATMKIKYRDTELWDADGALHATYDVSIRTKLGTMRIAFHDSIFNTRNGVEPTEYDVLSVLEKYDVGTYEDFCSEFGYDAQDKASRKTYRAVKAEYDNICRVFTEDQIERLREIQ